MSNVGIMMTMGKTRGEGKYAMVGVAEPLFAETPEEHWGDMFTTMKMKALRWKQKNNDDRSVDEILQAVMKTEQLRRASGAIVVSNGAELLNPLQKTINNSMTDAERIKSLEMEVDFLRKEKDEWKRKAEARQGMMFHAVKPPSDDQSNP